MELRVSGDQLAAIAASNEKTQIASLCRSVCDHVTSEIEYYPEILCDLTVRMFLFNLSVHGVTDIVQQSEITKKYFASGKLMSRSPYMQRWNQIMIGRNLSPYLKGKELLALLNTAEQA